MALSEMFEWRRTSAALHSLEQLLRCSLCRALTTQLCHVGQCEHVLCRQCVSAEPGACAVCRQPCHASECRPAQAHASLVHECRQLRQLLRLNGSTEQPPAGPVPPAQQLVDRLALTAPDSGTSQQTESDQPSKRRRVKAASQTSAPLVVAICEPCDPAASVAAKANKKNAKGETALHVASARGDAERVQRLLRAGAGPNVTDHAGWTPLHEACSSGGGQRTRETVRLLLSAGAVVDPAGDEMRTPLHEAVAAGDCEVAALLVAAGADVQARSLYGETPLQMAASQEHVLAALNTDRSVPSSEPRQDQQLVMVTAVVADGLDEEQLLLMKSVAKKYGWKTKSEVGVGTSHLVVGSAAASLEASFARLCALQVGALPVSVEWLHACARCPSAAPPAADDWLLHAEAVQRSVARASRLQPLLLAGLHIYLQGEFDDVTQLQRPQLCQLVQLAGAVLLSRPPNPESIPSTERTVPFHAPANSQLRDVSHVVIFKQRPSMRYDMSHVKSLPLDWLLLCLQTYTLAEPF